MLLTKSREAKGEVWKKQNHVGKPKAPQHHIEIYENTETAVLNFLDAVFSNPGSPFHYKYEVDDYSFDTGRHSNVHCPKHVFHDRFVFFFVKFVKSGVFKLKHP